MLIKGGALNKKNINNILLIQFGDIGDVVYSFPCARALKETFPAARVVMAVQKKAAGLVGDCQWVDDVIVVAKKKRSLVQALVYHKKFWLGVRAFNFDLAIDLRTGSRGAILALLSGAKQRVGRYSPVGNIWRAMIFSHLVLPEREKNQYIAEYYHDTVSFYGISTNELNPKITPSQKKKDAINTLMKEQNVPMDKPIFAIQPFSLWQYKEWSCENYITLITKITEQFDISVVITGSPSERVRAQTIVDKCNTEKVFNLTGMTQIGDLPAILRTACLFLGVDSAGVHIAAAVDTPTISLYGPSSATVWAPKGDKNVIVTGDMDCIPCGDTGCEGSMRSSCMEDLPVGKVLRVVCSGLENVAKRFRR